MHEPEQEAYGDWAVICIGGQYYLFGDYDPIGGHADERRLVHSSIRSMNSSLGATTSAMVIPIRTSRSRKDSFTSQHSRETDYVSPGPWVETVEARVGVDTDNDDKIDQWTDWTELKESYDYIPGFSKQIARTPAELDLSKLPAGYGFQIQLQPNRFHREQIKTDHRTYDAYRSPSEKLLPMNQAS